MLFLTSISDLSLKFYDKAALRRNIRRKPHIKTPHHILGKTIDRRIKLRVR